MLLIRSTIDPTPPASNYGDRSSDGRCPAAELREPRSTSSRWWRESCSACSSNRRTSMRSSPMVNPRDHESAPASSASDCAAATSGTRAPRRPRRARHRRRSAAASSTRSPAIAGIAGSSTVSACSTPNTWSAVTSRLCAAYSIADHTSGAGRARSSGPGARRSGPASSAPTLAGRRARRRRRRRAPSKPHASQTLGLPSIQCANETSREHH